MRWTPWRRYVAAILAGSASAALLLAVTEAVNARYIGTRLPLGVSSCTGLTPLGWMTPFLVVGVVMGVAWFLARPRIGAASEAVGHAPCPSCSQIVMTEWHICPYCGAPLDEDQGQTGDRETPGSDEQTE